MLELPMYPTVLTLAAALATEATAFAGVPFPVAQVLIVSGVVLAWFCAYRPRATGESGSPIQSVIRRHVARIFPLTIGATLIGSATVGRCCSCGRGINGGGGGRAEGREIAGRGR